MSFIIRNMKWLMLVSGALTFTMIYGLFAPQEALESMFGSSFNGPLEHIVVRSWSALVALIGLILIYGCFSQRHRVFSASVAAASKLIFVTLLVVYGEAFWGKAAPAIFMDCLVITITMLYLIAIRADKATAH